MRRTMKVIGVGLLSAAISCGVAASGIGRSDAFSRLRQRVVGLVRGALADSSVRNRATERRQNPTQTRLDGLARDSAKASAILRELGGRLKDRASQGDLALLQTAMDTLGARTHGQAAALAGVRSQLGDEVKKAREDSLALRAELAKMSERLSREQNEIIALRSEVVAAGEALHAHELRGEAAAKQGRDDSFTRLTSETNDKVILVAVKGFDHLKHGDSAAALEAFHAAKVWDRSSSEILYGIGLAHCQRGDTAAAERAVAQALQAEQARPTAEWYRRVMIGIQGPHRQAFDAMKADPTLHHRLAQTPR